MFGPCVTSETKESKNPAEVEIRYQQKAYTFIPKFGLALGDFEETEYQGE